jgi:hypothetical protein
MRVLPDLAAVLDPGKLRWAQMVVDCEASGAPVFGHRPTVTFINATCRSQ